MRLHYPSILPAPLRELSQYLTSEPPASAARRAKLRFRRTQFGFNMERVGYSVSTSCSLCNTGATEDNEHVLCHCPAHDAARHTCINSLDAMFNDDGPSNPMFPITADKLISPDIPLSSFPKLIDSALTITSTFFRHIAMIRAF